MDLADLPLITRVFRNGNSQAVRIPAELKLDTDTVQIFRNEAGDLVLRPVRQLSRGQALLEAASGFEADFIAHLEQAQALPVQEREAL
jgi:antitoxin VapB